jgi:hypothetical protein
LGISVKGLRYLHLKRAQVFDGNVADGIEEQNSGDIYLSPSTLINHAPEFPGVEWKDRIITIQSRLLYSTPELKEFRAKRTEESWYQLVSTIANVFSAHGLHSPSESLVDEILRNRTSLSV